VVSILSERRAFRPYGMAGGCPGERGLNLLRFAEDDRTISLGGKNTISVQPGDRLLIHSPGGGGYGAGESKRDETAAEARDAASVPTRVSGSLNQYSLDQESV
jgi:5-oxoprolinase (ATP-hydrolysing)